LSTFIKFCGVTNEADALTAIGLGVDAVGVIFAPSTRQVSLATAGDIVRRLPPEALVVGVFRDESPLRVVEIANNLGLRGVQLHGHESIQDVQYVSERVPLVINALSAQSPQVAHFNETGADLLLLDGPVPGSGEVFDWSLASSGPDPDRMIVSGGLDEHNVARAIETLRPFGVDVASGIEMAPGVKNPLAMKAFVDAVREADELVAQIDGQVDDDGEEPFDWMRD
jgi:phosphoribosylanthranilate isomerase